MLAPPLLWSPAPIPLERELQERLAWFIRLRWMAAGGILLGAWIVPAFIVPQLSPLPLCGIGLAVAGYNALFAVIRRYFEAEPTDPKATEHFIHAQMRLDWVSLICLVHFSGGIHSPVALAFAFHLIIGAILLSRRDCYLQVAFSALLLGGLAAVEGLGLWPPPSTGDLYPGFPGGPLSGFYRWLALTGFLGVTAFLTTSITARLRQKEEALFDLEQQVERAYGALQALDEERVWFARTTHHQLRAPLAAIQGLLEALPYAGPATQKQCELAARARRRVQDLLEMIRDLLDLAAAQRRLEGQPGEPVVLSECLKEALETARERATAKQVRLEVAVPASAAVRAEADDIRRIFSNLLDNAVKYTPAGGQVAFRAEQREGQVRAEVQDTGIGIEAADQQRIFQGFYRTQAARDTGEVGSGLGLSIVRQLVERWQGQLELHSAPGQGSRFAVILPAATTPPAG